MYRGPSHTRYGRSKNGRMNLDNFEEWFFTIVVPWARRREEKKVLIGDYLSSHLRFKVLTKCLHLNTSNSTYKCQPLDAAFFGSQKKTWRQIPQQYCTKYSSSTGLKNATFLSMLKTLKKKNKFYVAKVLSSDSDGLIDFSKLSI